MRCAVWLAVVLVAGVLDIPQAEAQSRRGYPRLMQGPMLGPVTPTTAEVWIRGSGPFSYAVEYDDSPLFDSPERTEAKRADKASDYTLRFTLEGLEPGRTYAYRLLAEGEVSKYQRGRPAHEFRTAPAGRSRFTVSFGSCARFQAASGDQPIWDVLGRRRPDLFFWLGDNIYGDALDPDILAEEYRRLRDVPAYQAVMASVPELAIWDDHDYGLNNHDRTNPIRREALEVFRRYWPNPAFGQADNPGVYFRYAYGGVDFFFLDTRSYRDPNAQPDGPGKTMLGRRQLDWLLDGLSGSDAPFKVLVSGSGFNSAKGPTGDAWSAFVHERDALFAAIVERGIDGVLLFSGDTHCAELNRLDPGVPGGYPLYELVSSPLAQAPNRSRPPLTGRERRVREPLVTATNAAAVVFDLTADDPTVTLNVVDSYGRLAWEPLTIRASGLRTGQ